VKQQLKDALFMGDVAYHHSHMRTGSGGRQNRSFSSSGWYDAKYDFGGRDDEGWGEEWRMEDRGGDSEADDERVELLESLRDIRR